MASRVLRKISFALLTILIGFATLDTGYRLVRSMIRPPGQEAIFAPDPVLGRRHIKNAKAVVLEWSKTTPNRVSINGFGFRGLTPRTRSRSPRRDSRDRPGRLHYGRYFRR